MKPNNDFPGFAKCVEMMHSKKPQTQEDGFGWLKQQASEFVSELVEAFETESQHGVKCWLFELIGESRSLEAMPLFEKYLFGDDESLCSWAAYGLSNLNTREARHTLYQGLSHKLSTVEDTERLHALIRRLRRQ